MKIIHTRNLNKKVFKLSDTESEYSLKKFIHDESYDIIKILTAAINPNLYTLTPDPMH